VEEGAGVEAVIGLGALADYGSDSD